MQIVTSWMRTGIEQGIQRETNLIVRLLQRKVGELEPAVEAQIRGLDLDQLEDLGEALLDFEEAEDLTTWGRIYDRVGTCSTLTARRSASSPRRS